MRPSRLDSWKEIANYLGCSEKTARRKEVQHGLPVHRMPGGSHSAVFAYVEELNRWIDGRQGSAKGWRQVLGDRGLSQVCAIGLAGVLVVVALVHASGFRVQSDVRLVGSPMRLTQSSSPMLPPVLTDSTNGYFQSQAPGLSSYQILRAGLGGTGTPEVLQTNIENPEPCAIAPSGRAMLVRSVVGARMADAPVFIQPLPSGRAQRLGHVLALDAAWTPDGQQVVFSQQEAVHLIPAAGGASRRAFDVPGRAFGFRWSPDESHLRFTVYDARTASYRIWQTTAQFDKAEPVPLGPASSSQQCCGAWSPDGSVYFFQALVDGVFQVFARHEQRGFWRLGPNRLTQLTSGQFHYRSPVPAFDGKKLLMLAHFPKSEVVYREQVSGRWLPLLEGVGAATASFSPDGTMLAFTRVPGHILWTCRMPGCTDQTQLTFSPHLVTMPRWSPDGAQIAVMFRTPGSSYQVGTVPAQGGRLVHLLPPGEEGADPDWSPDGKLLYFGGVPGVADGSTTSIRLVDLATRQITSIPESEGMYTPKVSPDGRYLAAVTTGPLGLAILDRVSGEWSRLPGMRVGYLNWSESSKNLFVLASSSQGPPKILAVNPASGKHETVAEISSLRQPSFSLGDWMGLAPGDIPLALRDLSTDELVAWQIGR